MSKYIRSLNKSDSRFSVNDDVPSTTETKVETQKEILKSAIESAKNIRDAAFANAKEKLQNYDVIGKYDVIGNHGVMGHYGIMEYSGTSGEQKKSVCVKHDINPWQITAVECSVSMELSDFATFKTGSCADYYGEKDV